MIYEGFFKLNQVRRNRNRLVDDLQEKRAKSHYQDRRNLLNRQRSSELRYNKSESSSLRNYNNKPTHIRETNSLPHKINGESGSSLPRLVPPTQISSNKPESVMKATTDKSEPIMRSKTTYGVGGSKIEQSKTMIDVNNFNPGKKESTIDQHYSKYMNQWAPRSRKSNSNHRIVENHF